MSTPTPQDGSERARGRTSGATLLALGAVIVILPFSSGFPLTDDPYPQLRGVPWLDLASIALIAAVAPRVRDLVRHRDLGAGAGLWAILLVILAASLVVHPSVIGAQTLVRAAGTGAVAVAVGSLARGERALVLAYLAAVVLLEVAVGAIQVAAGGATGILGETPDPLPLRGGVVIPRGTLSHPYVLAGLGMVCAALLVAHAVAGRRSLPWIALAGLAAAPVGMTYSRAALLAYAAACAILAWAGWTRPVYRWALIALLAGAGIPALLLSDGWLLRAEERVDLTNRTRLVDQALVLIAEQPLLGVGTGGYVAAARTRFPGVPFTQAVHNVPLLVAVEAGIVAGIVVVALLIVLGWSALRGGPAALSLYVMFVPFMVVDVYPYVSAQGAVLTGLWIGGIDRTGLALRSLRWWRWRLRTT